MRKRFCNLEEIYNLSVQQCVSTVFVVFAGGSVVPGDWGVSGQAERSREDPSRERTDRARPNPYTRAAGNRAGERSPRAAPTGAELPEPTARARAREAGPRAPHKSVATVNIKCNKEIVMVQTRLGIEIKAGGAQRVPMRRRELSNTLVPSTSDRQRVNLLQATPVD
ncbi:hypothetical protein B0H11DRAFT_1902392 [Mycena galericulata]|nr:hypothetical protein B0H11DRAFT_1902392 [Mycena galericulata]